MASCSDPRIRTYRASGTIPARRFVKLDTGSADKDPTVVVCESGRALGISMNDSDVTTGNSVEVALPGGGAVLKLAGTVSLGQSIKPTTGGKGVVTASAGDYAGAFGVEKGVDGDEIGVEVVRDQKYSADAV